MKTRVIFRLKRFAIILDFVKAPNFPSRIAWQEELQ
jgi:hypothetical protein